MVEGSQQLSDRGPQLGDGVLGGDGVVDGGRVEHPGPPLHGTGRGGDDLGVLEQPSRADRCTQAVAVPGKDRCMECLGAGVDAGGCLPAEVEAESVTGLPIRQSLECLQQHHRGQHAGRDRRSSLHRAGVQIGEVVVTEHHVTVVGEEAIDRSELQPVTEKIPRVLEALLGLRGPERHGQILSAAQVKLRDPLGDYFCSLLEPSLCFPLQRGVRSAGRRCLHRRGDATRPGRPGRARRRGRPSSLAAFAQPACAQFDRCVPPSRPATSSFRHPPDSQDLSSVAASSMRMLAMSL